VPALRPTPAAHDPWRKRLEYALKRLQLGLLALPGRRPPAPSGVPQLGPHSRVLAIRLNNLGDALVVTPLLAALKAQTGARVEVVCSPRNRIVLDGHPAIDTVHVLPKGIAALWRLARALRHQHYDAVIDLHDDVSTTVAWLVALTPAAVKVGLDHALPSLYTSVAPLGDPAREHVLTRLLRIAPLLGLSVDPATANVVFPVPDAAVAAARAWRAEHAPGRPLVGLNLSAGTRARYWAVAQWQQVARFVAERGGVPVILAAPPDRALAEQVAAAGPWLSWLSSDYRAFAAFVYGLDLLVTPDTAVVHLASAARVPVFGLYVGVRPEACIWYPYQSAYATYQTAQPDLNQTTAADVIPLLAPFLDACLSPLSAP